MGQTTHGAVPMGPAMPQPSFESATALPPLGDYMAEPVDPQQLALRSSPDWLRLLVDVRRGDSGVADGMAPAMAPLRNGYNRDQVGEMWAALRNGLRADEIGGAALAFFDQHLDLTAGSGVAIAVADAGESIGSYMDRVASRVLRRPARSEDTDVRLRTLHPVHVPGSRFDDAFPADNAVAFQGLLARGQVQEALHVLDNLLHDTMRLGYAPNLSRIGMLRGQTDFTSFMVDSLSGLYGPEAGRHYLPALVRNLEFIDSGKERLAQLPAGAHGAVRRIGRLPSGHYMYRPYDDATINYHTGQGVREESAAEDADLGARLVHNMRMRPEDEQARAWERLMLSLRAACDMQDMSDYQLADRRNLITSRTSEIYTPWQQAVVAHKKMLVAQIYESLGDFAAAEKQWAGFNELKEAVNLLSWRQIDQTHGHYTDVLQDGTQTGALNAAQILPLLVGGDFVPYDRARMTINTWRRKLLGEHGLHTSDIPDCPEQWSGRIDWPSLATWAAMASMQAASDAKRNNQDPQPFIDFAEDVLGVMAGGIDSWYAAHGTVPERVHGTSPREVAVGGEYCIPKKGEPAIPQTGFGMTIGARRVAAALRPSEIALDPGLGSWMCQFGALAGNLALARSI